MLLQCRACTTKGWPIGRANGSPTAPRRDACEKAISTESVYNDIRAVGAAELAGGIGPRVVIPSLDVVYCWNSAVSRALSTLKLSQEHSVHPHRFPNPAALHTLELLQTHFPVLEM